MKKLLYLVLLITLMGCSQTVVYPNYTLIKVEVIPDSLKVEHREYITETIRATHQHLSAGDYERPRKTIGAISQLADKLYGVQVITLRKYYEEYRSLVLMREDMTPKEIMILDSLTFKNR